MSKEQHDEATEAAQQIVKQLDGELKNLCRKIRANLPEHQVLKLEGLGMIHENLFKARVPEIEKVVRQLRVKKPAIPQDGDIGGIEARPQAVLEIGPTIVTSPMRVKLYTHHPCKGTILAHVP